MEKGKKKQKVTRETPTTFGLHASLICGGDTKKHQPLLWNHGFCRRMCHLKVLDIVHTV